MNYLTVGLDTEDDAGRCTMFAISSRVKKECVEYDEDNLDGLLGHFNDLVSAYGSVNVWCLNLGYDLVNLFGDTLPDVCRLYLAKKKIVGAHLKGLSKVRFFEIGRFLPKMNLTKIGGLVGLKKLDIDFNEQRCQRDADIANRAGDRITRCLGNLGITLRYSPLSSALAAVEDLIGHQPRPKKEILQAGKAALYGGRAETFFIGHWGKDAGPLYYFDFKAQYAQAMLEPLPDFTSWTESKTPRTSQYIADCYIRVQAINGIGPLPCHDPERGLVFPQGVFRGTYTSTDLDNENVEVLRYHKCWNFYNTAPHLRQFIRRLIPKDNENPISRTIKKGIYTGLSGKWSQGNEYSFLTTCDKARPEDFWNGVAFGDWILANRTGKYPRHTNFVWTAFIQARARKWLNELFAAIHRERGVILYCDTDSALCSLSSMVRVKRLLRDFDGRLHTEKLAWAKIFAPKVYVYGTSDGITHVQARGIPGRLHESIGHGILELETEIPNSFVDLMKEAALNAHCNALKNRWRSRRYSVPRKFKNRDMRRGTPWTAPVTLSLKK